MDFGTNLRRIRTERGMSMAQLAAAVGTSRQTIHRYESGLISNVPQERIMHLAEVLTVRPDQLMGWDEPAFHEDCPTERIPLLGRVACGEPIFACEEYDSYVTVDRSLHADFCLHASGDSMKDARINDGDLVFVRMQETVDDGDIAVVLIDDEATLKRVYYDAREKRLVLMPANPDYAPMVYTGESLSRIRILGKAIAFRSML